MIRIFHAIVETRYAPEDKDVIWLFNGVQYYWTDKGWTPIGFQSNGDIQGVIESLNTIKLAIDNLPHGGGGGGGDTSDVVKHIVVNGTEIVKTEGGVVSINIPIRVSELINDNGYTTGNAVDTKLNALANQLQQALTELDNKKQNNLISGVNIKTINHQSLLGSGNIDIQGGSGSSYSKFKSIVFKRQSTIPTTPTGGSYDNPVPEGWSDGVPSGELTLWMSSRWFSTEPDFVDYWTTPSQATDTADIDFEWSSLVNPALPDIDSSAWHNEAQPEDIWMAFRKKSNGVWGPWSKIKIKGEAGEKGDKGDDGKDGTSVHILGAVSNPSELPSTGTVGDSYIYKGPDTTVGGKPWKTGDLIVWDGDSWESVGQIQGPKGESNYVFIAYSNDGGYTLTINDDGVQDGTKPGKYVGYCITTSNIRPINASSYQPFMKFQGEDGFGYEFIYKLTTDNNPPLIPDSENRDEYIPDGWNDNPSISEDKPYCWMVYRKKFTTTSGEYKWSQFIGDGNGHANLFSKFSNDGTPGESAYSLQLSNTSASVNCDEMYQVLPNATLPSPVSFQLYYGKNPDNESDVTYDFSMIPGLIFGVTVNTVNKTISFDRNLWSEWDSVEIVVKAFKGGILVATNKFSLTMNPPGPEGKPATNHWLVLSDTTVKQVSSMIGTVETKELYPSAITVRTFKQVGDENAEETTRNLRVTYSYDGNQETNFTTYDTGLILEKGHKVLTFKLYDENSVLRDTKTVTFLSDGNTGRQGAAVRGPIYWTNDTRRWCNGKESATNPPDAEWIDIVIYDGKYYRCTTSYNGRESDTWDLVKHNWTLADGQFDFVATKVLLANDAKIQFLSSNEIYMMNGDNPVAGVSGGEYNFWAGASTPDEAPYKVKYNGEVIATKGTFGPWELSQAGGLTTSGVHNKSSYGARSIDLIQTNGPMVSRFTVTTATGQPVLKIQSNESQNNNYTAIETKGLIYQNEEFCITNSNEQPTEGGAQAQRNGVVHMQTLTKAEYQELEGLNSCDPNTLYIIIDDIH